MSLLSRNQRILACVIVGLFVPAPSRAQYIISTVAGGSFPPAGASAVSVGFAANGNLAVDGFGNQYVSFRTGVFKVTTDGVISRVAGSTTFGFSGDGGPALGAEFNEVGAVAVDLAGNVYVADRGNYRVRKIANGIVSTIAGNGSQGYSGDGGPAVTAKIGYVIALAIDLGGNVYISEGDNVSRIREVSVFDATINTIAGNGTSGYSGDGGPATSAMINNAGGIAVDSAGNLYIADALNYRIRFVSVLNSTITTIAGTGVFGYSGDGGPAISAEMSEPAGLALDSAGNIYFTDPSNLRVREFRVEGIISTVAGNGTQGEFGDTGPATSVGIGEDSGIGTDSQGNVYFVELLTFPYLEGSSRRRLGSSGLVAIFPRPRAMGPKDIPETGAQRRTRAWPCLEPWLSIRRGTSTSSTRATTVSAKLI